jgi:transposase-like protein
MDIESLPGMKTSTNQVASALSMYYEGLSLNIIRRHLQQMYNSYPSDSTVYEWIDRFTKQAIEQAKEYNPEVSNIWVADQTMLKVGGQKVWFWDMLDAKTRYLLASHLSAKRTILDCREFMAKAAQKIDKPPKVVITDQLTVYVDAIELTFGAETKHIPIRNLRTTPCNQLIVRFHSTLKTRNKVMKKLKSLERAKDILQGWLVYYNFLRPQEALGGQTPAEKAGIKYQLCDHMRRLADEHPQRRRESSIN